jgi:hypothetical protein
MLSLPNSTAPCAASRAHTVESWSGTWLASTREPLVVRIPLVLQRSFNAIGTPWKGPRQRPAMISDSACCAAARAVSAVTVI